MTLHRVSFAFLCEGTSDQELVPHLQTLLVQFGVEEAIGTADTSKGPLGIRLKQLLATGTKPDIVFLHRDADGHDSDPRTREINEAVRSASLRCPHIPVIPVQETEAWLLVDPAAIRAVVGRPHGRAKLELPKLSAIESTRNPKEVLARALLAASDSTGRRRDQVKKQFPVHRRILLQRLDPSGPVRELPSWKALEKDIEVVLTLPG